MYINKFLFPVFNADTDFSKIKQKSILMEVKRWEKH